MNLLVSVSKNIYSLDQKSMNKASKNWDSLIHPPKSLGKMEEMVVKMAGIYSSSVIEENPKKCIIAFASDNGVYEEGVSLHPQEITRYQFENFTNGKCAVAVLSKFNNIDIVPVDIGMIGTEKIKGVYDYKIREGTNNITKDPAMTKSEAIKSVEIGIEIAEKCIVEDYKIIGLGEMGISNTTTSTAIISVISGKNPQELSDYGSGINLEQVKNKADVIQRAIDINMPNPTDGIDILAKVGGFEIGAMAGVILGCAANKIPVVLDGYITYAGALIAYKINPKSIDYVIASHLSDEKASKVALDILKLDPILNMNMRLGEGTGAALAMNVIDSSIYTYNNMAKFEDEAIGKLLKEKNIL